MPEPYAPPEQRKPLEDYSHSRVHPVVNMQDPDARAHLVSGISEKLSENWRWAGQRATVWVVPGPARNPKFIVDFTLPEVTMKDTGPVTMSFFVNDQVVERIRYDAPGEKHFEKPIPPDWPTPGKQITVSAEIDKMWVAPADGAKLGFILTRMGIEP